MSADLFSRKAWPASDAAHVVRIAPSAKGDARTYAGAYAVVTGDLVSHWRAELADGSAVVVAKSRCQDSSVTAARTATKVRKKKAQATTRPEAISPEFGEELPLWGEA